MRAGSARLVRSPSEAYRPPVRIGTPDRCPRCGEPALIDILYGTPDETELHELWVQGKAMIRPGSCADGPPGWMCRECGYEYAEYRASLRAG
jgi:hypothetical protein